MLPKAIAVLAAKAAVTKIHRLGSLNNRDLFLLVLKAGRKSKIECWPTLLLMRLLLACRVLCSLRGGPHPLHSGMGLPCSVPSLMIWTGLFTLLRENFNRLTACIFSAFSDCRLQ